MDREQELERLHAEYNAAIEEGDWRSFKQRYAEYLNLYLDDNPHYADPMLRREYIEKKLEGYRERFGLDASGSSSGRFALLAWTMLGVVLAYLLYLLLGGPVP